MDSSLIKQLTQVLNQENEIYDTLAKLSNNKTQVIVEGKVQDLDSIVRIEQSLVLKISKLEQQREEVVEIMCNQLGIKPEEVTISEILKLADNDESKELKNSQDKLRVTLNGLKEKNELNSKLLKNSLDYIDFSLNMMTSIGTINNNYESTGESGDSKKRSIFDIKL